MIDPNVAKTILTQLAGGATVDNEDLRERSKQGKLNLRAMIKASTNGCDCEPCGILRESLAVMMGEDPGEVKPGAPSLHSPA